MKVLVINSGSSSVKYQFIDTETREYIAKGLVDRIGLQGSSLKQERVDGHKIHLSGDILEHQMALEYVLAGLVSTNHGVINSLNEIDAVGHRLVHGGEHFKDSVLITEKVMDVLNDCIDLAPLHNPPNIKGIQAARHHLPNVPMVGVFDTAFHSKMPEHAYIYGIPYVLYKRHGIRRYGFHGTSHYYVSRRYRDLVEGDLDKLKIITCHLGNGGSIAAIKGGYSIDTSMGFTPLEGLLMGTRSGDMDPGIISHVMVKEELEIREMSAMLNKHSGLVGISGLSSDMREIEEALLEGNKRAELAFNIFAYRVKKYIASYAAALGGVDGIVFTGGIGENSKLLRENVLDEMEFMGVVLDKEKNRNFKGGSEGFICADESTVKVAVIPTNEELVIAIDTEKIAKKLL
ncbi:MAG: acetate kinase [Candidatus Marinimicrobia bacterium]|nr:acetate kinase [Candidatus Neomarinimicrobiota bacterium]